MKQNSSERYSIAWFKLAECVARGEKERALGVYRLLSHSIDDAAFARQLEGDIFLSFEEPGQAQQRYKEAALLYKRDHRYQEAAAVYEQLHSIEPLVYEYRMALIALYHQIGMTDRCHTVVHDFGTFLIKNKKFDDMNTCSEQFVALVGVQETALIAQQWFLLLLEEPMRPNNFIMLDQLRKTIDLLCAPGIDHHLLQKFLVVLEQKDPVMRHNAHAYLTERA